MANQKYDQVIDLLATGWLNWATDPIIGLLFKDADFDASHKTLSDLNGATQIATAPIDGRYLAPGGVCMGYPAFFQMVGGDTDYQMIIVQQIDPYNPNLLAFYDTVEDGPLHLDNTGTLVVRPTIPDDMPPDEVPTSDYARMWLRF